MKLPRLIASSSFLLAALVAAHGAAETGGFRQQLELRPDVKPTFQVTPMVQRFEAARGKLVPFEFAIESIDRITTVNVQPVALRQDPNGTIMPDTDSPAPNNVELLSAPQMVLADNDSKTIRCQVRVPSTKANFHTFGILVTDLGRIVDRAPINAGDQAERRVGIRFVTRYLLRCDITVTGARGEDASQIVIESAELFEEGGYAKARVWITNPSDSPLEFQTRCRMLRDGSRIGKSTFNVVMPNRSSMEPPDRFDIRILPGARLRLEELIPEAVFPGDHQLEIEIVSNRRTRKKAVFPLTIDVGDFPAQDASVVQAARDVTVSPAQVELSLRRAGKRMVPIEIENLSQQEVRIEITPAEGAERLAEWLVLRPTETTIKAGSQRKILVMMNTKEDFAMNQYVQLNVEVKSAAGESVGSFTVPVALLARTEEKPEVQVQPIQWDGASDPPAFVVPISNSGNMHLPLHAKLTMTDAFGRNVEMEAGFGKWLLPGAASELRFRTKFAPPPGEYRCKLVIDRGAEDEKLQLESALQFGASSEPTLAPEASAATTPTAVTTEPSVLESVD
ncbi:MAG: hypothetical protein ABI614_12695 [Planctomycetota bacterium]